MSETHIARLLLAKNGVSATDKTWLKSALLTDIHRRCAFL